MNSAQNKRNDRLREINFKNQYKHTHTHTHTQLADQACLCDTAHPHIRSSSNLTGMNFPPLLPPPPPVFSIRCAMNGRRSAANKLILNTEFIDIKNERDYL